MQKLKIFLWIAILLIVQTCFAPYIAIGSIMPEVLFVFAVGYALHIKDKKLRIVIPMICGVLVDLTGGGIIGVFMLIYVLAAMAGVWIADLLYRSEMLFRFPLLFVLSLGEGLVYFLCNAGVMGSMGDALWGIIMPTACYNVVSAVLIFPLVSKTFKQRR